MGDIIEPQKIEDIWKLLAIPDSIKEIQTIDGNNYGELRNYLDTVNEILEVIGDIDRIPQGKLWLRAMRNKIVGDASMHLINFQVPLNWDEIEHALWDYFYHFRVTDNEHICNKDLWLTQQNLLQH